ncbi:MULTISPECIES: GNAT family N-acetyltransferase [Spirulina sp. CCY15215]|uniref:GNAT family N-acetyltransferase n=1 Tax=Spirulina sp. CCY15215 TaxID=2767591 RepID=UPI00194EC907|nr:GNAT family N-acetyltransferase [Spirulina major]
MRMTLEATPRETDAILIRPYNACDFTAIASIYNESIAAKNTTMDCEFFSADKIRLQVEKFSDRETILVAQKGDRTIGWGIIKRYSDRQGYRVCCETSIYLSLAETGKGYGKKLQTILLQQVKEFGYHHIVAKILACNQKSITFHQYFGFELVGIQKEIGYLNGCWHDMAILQLIFPDIPPHLPDLA